MKVKVGQWVRSVDGFIVRVRTNMNEFIIYKDINGIERGTFYKKITAIYTPDSSGNYIKQWSDEQ